MYGRFAYAAMPWSAGDLTAPPTGQLPPPIPGDSATFAYASPPVARPWSYLAWAGGYPPLPYPGGGVLAHADAPAGVVRIQAWWPDATLLHLVRLGPDSSRTPVRGAYPLTLVGSTRRNLCQNPSFEAGLNGLLPDAGNPTLTQLATATAPHGASVLRATNASAGSNGVTLPTVLSGVVGGATVTVGLAVRTSATAGGLSVSIAWVDGLGAAVGTTTAALSASQLTMATGAFLRAVNAFTVPAGAVNGTLKVVATGMPAGGTVDLDAITVEAAATDGSYCDGDQVGGSWLGTPDLSVSTVAPVQLINDAECPLDTPVTYELVYAGIVGGHVTSTPPVSLSGGAGSWLTHPSHPGTPVKVLLAKVPVLERDINQGVFLPLGARRPVVISAARRQAPTSRMQFITLTFDERDALLALFDEPFPVLLRLPREFGYPAPMWLAIGRVTEDRGERKGWHDSVILDAEVTEVNAPALP